MSIFLCRHGERIDQVSKRWSKSTLEPWDPPITTKGKKQIYSSVHQISKKEIKSIIASPMRRTVESAEIASSILGIKFDVEVGLVEWQNPEWFDELKIGNFYYLGKFLAWSGKYRKTIYPLFPETEEQAQFRCACMIEKILQKKKQNTLIITHENGIIGFLKKINTSTKKNKINKIEFGEILEINIATKNFNFC